MPIRQPRPFSCASTAPRRAACAAVALLACLGVNAAQAAAPYRGRAVDAVLDELATAADVQLVYTSAVVPGATVVAVEPCGRTRARNAHAGARPARAEAATHRRTGLFDRSRAGITRLVHDRIRPAGRTHRSARRTDRRHRRHGQPLCIGLRRTRGARVSYAGRNGSHATPGRGRAEGRPSPAWRCQQRSRGARAHARRRHQRNPRHARRPAALRALSPAPAAKPRERAGRTHHRRHRRVCGRVHRELRRPHERDHQRALAATRRRCLLRTRPEPDARQRAGVAQVRGRPRPVAGLVPTQQPRRDRRRLRLDPGRAEVHGRLRPRRLRVVAVHARQPPYPARQRPRRDHESGRNRARRRGVLERLRLGHAHARLVRTPERDGDRVVHRRRGRTQGGRLRTRQAHRHRRRRARLRRARPESSMPVTRRTAGCSVPASTCARSRQPTTTPAASTSRPTTRFPTRRRRTSRARSRPSPRASTSPCITRCAAG